MDIGSLLNRKDSPSPRARSPASQITSLRRLSESHSEPPSSTQLNRTQPTSILPKGNSTITTEQIQQQTPESLSVGSRGSRLADISTKALESFNNADTTMTSARSPQLSFDGSMSNASLGRGGQDSVDMTEGREVLPKTLQCSGCSKMFARRSDLVRHERIHSGHRPHRCSWAGCDKSFIQRSALTVHERVHTGAKPHECTECGKPFSDSSSLARHRRTHSGLRPYQCDFPGCNKDFTRRTTLTRHMQQHTTKGHVPVTNADTRRRSGSTTSSAMEAGEFPRDDTSGEPMSAATSSSGPSMFHSFALDDREGKKMRRRHSRASQASNQTITTQDTLPPINESTNQFVASQYQLAHEAGRDNPTIKYEDPHYRQMSGSTGTAPNPSNQQQNQPLPHGQAPQLPSSAPYSPQPDNAHAPATQTQYQSSYQQNYPSEPSRGPQQPPAYYPQQALRPVSHTYENQFDYYKNRGS